MPRITRPQSLPSCRRGCAGWCVRCYPGSSSGRRSCCYGWRRRSYATNGLAVPTRDAAPPAAKAGWSRHLKLVVVVLGWMGLSFIVQEHLGHRQSGLREMVPRLVLGLTATASSMWCCALVIDVADAVARFIAASPDVTPSVLLRAPLEPLLTAAETANTGLAVFIALLYLVFGFFVLYLLVHRWWRSVPWVTGCMAHYKCWSRLGKTCTSLCISEDA